MKDVDERPMPFGVPSKGVGPGPLKPTGRSSVLMKNDFFRSRQIVVLDSFDDMGFLIS